MNSPFPCRIRLRIRFWNRLKMGLFETLRHRRGRVLFVSETNSCRDQMAEAFARALGEDSLLAFSAGTRPASAISGAACAVMTEQGTPLYPDQKPRPLADLDLSWFDVIVNLGALNLPAASALVLEPLVPSPLADDLESHRAVRDRMEIFVRFLIEHFRRAQEWSPELARDSISTGAATSGSQKTPGPPLAATLLPDAATQPAI